MSAGAIDVHCQKSRHACPSRADDIGSHVAIENGLKLASFPETGTRS